MTKDSGSGEKRRRKPRRIGAKLRADRYLSAAAVLFPEWLCPEDEAAWKEL